MNDTPQGVALTAPKQPKPWRWALYLAVVAMAVWAALLVHDRYDMLANPTSRPAEGRPLDLSGLERRKPATRRAAASRPASRPAGSDMASRFAAVIGEALDAGNLSALEGDPGELSPPETAVRRWASRGEGHGRVQELARYDWPGTIEQGASYYGGMLADKGFRCHRESRPAEGTSRLEYIKDETYVVVTLRRQRQDARMSEIAVVVLTVQE